MDNRLILAAILQIIGLGLFVVAWLFGGLITHVYAWGFFLAGMLTRRPPGRREVRAGGTPSTPQQ